MPELSVALEELYGYTVANQTDTFRKGIEPYRIGTYLAAASGNILLTGGVDNKVSLAVTAVTDPPPKGFDIYLTPQGTALRFIGSGLGNGDTAVCKSDVMAGLLASIGSDNDVTLKAKTRPYTETDFANAVDIPGYAINRKMPVNDLGAVALVAPFFRMNDGDLLEIVAHPLTGISIDIKTFAFEIWEG